MALKSINTYGTPATSLKLIVFVVVAVVKVIEVTIAVVIVVVEVVVVVVRKGTNTKQYILLLFVKIFYLLTAAGLLNMFSGF